MSNPNLQDEYDALRSAAEDDYSAGLTLPDRAVYDIPATNYRWVISSGLSINPPSGTLPVGHLWNGSAYREYQSFVRFETITLPSGYDTGDIIDAQIVLRLSHDPLGSLGGDTDTGVITIHPATTTWWLGGSAFGSYTASVVLGLVDLPPFMIAEEVTGFEDIRVLPLPANAPLSFGHDPDSDGSGTTDKALVDVVRDWIANSGDNKGVALVADLLTNADIPTADQHVYFKNTNAVLRLTLQR